MYKCCINSGIKGPDDPKLIDIREERGYTYFDVTEVCPDKLPNYEDKIKSFYKVQTYMHTYNTNCTYTHIHKYMHIYSYILTHTCLQEHIH